MKNLCSFFWELLGNLSKKGLEFESVPKWHFPSIFTFVCDMFVFRNNVNLPIAHFQQRKGFDCKNIYARFPPVTQLPTHIPENFLADGWSENAKIPLSAGTCWDLKIPQRSLQRTIAVVVVVVIIVLIILYCGMREFGVSSRSWKIFSGCSIFVVMYICVHIQSSTLICWFGSFLEARGWGFFIRKWIFMWVFLWYWDERVTALGFMEMHCLFDVIRLSDLEFMWNAYKFQP